MIFTKTFFSCQLNGGILKRRIYTTIDKNTERLKFTIQKNEKFMIKNMVKTSEPKNQEFRKHNEPQPKIMCSYKKKSVYTFEYVIK